MIEVKVPKSEKDWDAYYDLRYRILREPLGKERGSERNEGDETGVHFALVENNTFMAVHVWILWMKQSARRVSLR